MKEFFSLTVPKRLRYLQVLVTAALMISFALSYNLWTGNALYPDHVLIHSLVIKGYYPLFLCGISIICLLLSLFAKHSRLFLLIALTINVLLVLGDLNRLQPWFFSYNSILLLLLFYNGRVDDSSHFSTIFISIQFIPCAMYLFNGTAQFNSGFLQNELVSVLEPVRSVSSERQFAFMISAGRSVPFVLIFLSFSLLIRALRFLSIPLALLFHITMTVLLFPTGNGSNPSLWLMNIVFCLLIMLLYSGETKDRYFSPAALLQKPLFYLVIFSFWVTPALQALRIWSAAPSITFRTGRNLENRIAESDYERLPHYIRHFCQKKDNVIILRTGEWCRHELGSEPLLPVTSVPGISQNREAVALQAVKESEDELSSL